MTDREHVDRAERTDEQPTFEAPVAIGQLTSGLQSAGDIEKAEFELAMQMGRQVMRDHHAVLAALAK